MPKISCDNGFCIYQNKGACTLDQIQLDTSGSCSDCVHINIPNDTLEDMKKQLLLRFSK